MLEKRQTGQFIVETEDGERIDVFEYTGIILTPSIDAAVEKKHEGMKEYRTAKNRLLKRLDGDTFEIVETGRKVKRVS